MTKRARVNRDTAKNAEGLHLNFSTDSVYKSV